MRNKILLSGYFGFENLGDEAILYSIVEELKKIEGVEIVALSANPQRTTEKFGIRAADRMKIPVLWREIKNCDLFISGGGSLLQDVTSNRSLKYYLILLKIAKSYFGKKVMVYAQGIGPINDPKNRKKTAKILNLMDTISVRDEESKKELLDMGVIKDIKVTADTVFLLDTPDKIRGKDCLQRMGVDLEKKTIGISIRKWKTYDTEIVRVLKKTIEYLQSKDLNILLLPFHHPGDLEISQTVFKDLKSTENVFVLRDQLTEREMLSVIANTDIMLSMRLHGLIFGVVCNSYPVGISYDPKIDALMQEIGMPAPVSVEELSFSTLSRQLDDAIENMAARKTQTEQVAKKMKEKAMKNIELVKELLR